MPFRFHGLYSMDTMFLYGLLTSWNIYTFCTALHRLFVFSWSRSFELVVKLSSRTFMANMALVILLMVACTKCNLFLLDMKLQTSLWKKN